MVVGCTIGGMLLVGIETGHTAVRYHIQEWLPQAGRWLSVGAGSWLSVGIDVELAYIAPGTATIGALPNWQTKPGLVRQTIAHRHQY
ncbi:MAG: hypothetical protein WA364_00550 [Candidatus Nitrosopolaris sp.]